MSKVSAALTYADVPGFPAGSVVDHVSVSVSGAADAKQDVPAGTASVDFDLDAGDYVASAQAFDAAGNGLGTAVSAKFTIDAPQTVSLSLPASVTVA